LYRFSHNTVKYELTFQQSPRHDYGSIGPEERPVTCTENGQTSEEQHGVSDLHLLSKNSPLANCRWASKHRKSNRSPPRKRILGVLNPCTWPTVSRSIERSGRSESQGLSS
jgi:hypothetical protein